MCSFNEPVSGTGCRYVPRKTHRVSGDKLAWNERLILIAGMPRAVRGEHHNSRSAIATGSRAARTEGDSPPMNPIKRANRIPSARRSGVMRKANATFENVCQFIVEVV